MDAIPDNHGLQAFACGLFKKIASKSPSGKNVLLSGRALNVCRRATLICPFYANLAIEALR